MRVQQVKANCPTHRGFPGSAEACRVSRAQILPAPGQTTSGTPCDKRLRRAAAEGCVEDALASSSIQLIYRLWAISPESREAYSWLLRCRAGGEAGSTSVAGAELDAAPHRKGGFS